MRNGGRPSWPRRADPMASSLRLVALRRRAMRSLFANSSWSWCRYNVRLSDAYNNSANADNVSVSALTYQNVNLARRLLRGWIRLASDIAGASHGVDEPRFGAHLDLVPEMIDVDVDHVRQPIPVEAPHVLGDHRA